MPPLDDVIPFLRSVGDSDRRAMISILAKDAWSIELAQNNPCLFFLLVRAVREEGIPLGRAPALVRMRRRDLLAAMGFDSSASVERFLRRLVFRNLGVDEELVLRALIQHPLPSWARHWRQPYLPLLSLVQYPRWEVAAQALDSLLLHDVRLRFQWQQVTTKGGEPDPWMDLFAVARNIAEVIRLIDRGPETMISEIEAVYVRQLVSVRSLEILEELHQQVIFGKQSEWACLARARFGHIEWPAPPVAGTSDIVPVNSVNLLVEEGESMKHCIIRYADEIVAGHGYVYRLLRPERATVYLSLEINGKWQVQEMKLSCNRTPSSESWKAVNAWIQ